MANATIRVQFGLPEGSTSGHLSAEIDNRPDGLNGGRTAFNPGETVNILVYKSDNVDVTETICSAGSLVRQGTALVEVSEELMFEDSDTASLGKPARAGAVLQTTWQGRSLWGLSLLSDRMTVKANGKGVAVAKVTYETQAQVYALFSPATLDGETDFSILALIKGEAT